MASTYYNPNRDREFNIQGQAVPQIIRDFLTHESKIYHLSPFSIRNYCIVLRTFLQWLVLREQKGKAAEEENELSDNEDDIDISNVSLDTIKQIKASDIADYLMYCRTVRNNGASARASKLSVLNTFFTYCVLDAAVMRENPASSVSPPKKITRPAKYMTGHEAILLINACDQGETPARDVCIATFMLNCGIRISELVAINLSDIEGNTLKIQGNGRMDRLIGLNEDCLTALDFWKTERAMYSLNDNALFVSKRYGSRITERAVQQMLNKAFLRAGLKEKGYTAHNLRFTAGKLMYQTGKFDVPDLQMLLGHKSTAFASRYSLANGNQARDAMSEFRISENIR